MEKQKLIRHDFIYALRLSRTDFSFHRRVAATGGEVMDSELGCAFRTLGYVIFIVGFFIAAALIISELQP